MEILNRTRLKLLAFSRLSFINYLTFLLGFKTRLVKNSFKNAVRSCFILSKSLSSWWKGLLAVDRRWPSTSTKQEKYIFEFWRNWNFFQNFDFLRFLCLIKNWWQSIFINRRVGGTLSLPISAFPFGG